MKRPHVVCHMMGSIDGRIVTERWALTPAAEKQYEAVHALHRVDAWMCGRKTFQGDFMEQPRDAKFGRAAKVPPVDFIAPEQLRRKGEKVVYAVAVDPAGRIRWDNNVMRGDRFVVITTQQAPSGYLADLRAKSISYLVAGKKEVDFGAALERLHRIFGIRKLALEGGGGINGSVLAAGLVDEISLLLCAQIDGDRCSPTVFDLPVGREDKLGTTLKLLSVQKRPGDVVWLRYRVQQNP
ncbi:RibD family protein [Opitutus sp. ER46]|uniref:RibD family protein n=1 Tax=Opitutus sp. ER46 TaxID=2161864 RepID=UPI000D3002A5|nr:RibD family protein [Opitutus sp. ER46]PTY00149.1 deaminase [Opitutus sp. ER46]